jgi:protein-disulfide isomerase
MFEKQNLAIPLAIVIAGAFIGGGLYFGTRSAAPLTPAPAQGSAEVKNVPEVTAGDHIRGSLTAPVIVVEYTDLECPYCKQFDGTMKQVLAAYGGKVAWVARNFPLQQLHPNAPALALAAECVADLGGNEAYWKFWDSIIQQSPINTFFDMTKVTPTAVSVGVDSKAFDACVASGKYQDKVGKEFNDAVAGGGNGTPFNVLVLQSPVSNGTKKALTNLQATLPPGTFTLSKDGRQIAMPGSQPLDNVKQILNILLAGK